MRLNSRHLGFFLSVSLDHRPDPILVLLESETEAAALDEAIDILNDMIGFNDAWMIHRWEGGARTIEIGG